MAETLLTVRNLKLFNRLNKSIKQGITDLQNKDFESSENYINFALKTGKQLEGLAEALLKYETLDVSDVERIIEGQSLEKPTVADLIEKETEKA